jgi:hypothetical protein
MTIRPVLKDRLVVAAALVLSIIPVSLPAALAQRVTLPSHGASKPMAAVDVGTVPQSQMLTLTVRLKPTDDRQAALDQEIADQQTAGSAEYRRWVTPQEFAATFGATDEQFAAVSSWLESQGLAAGALSAGKTRLTVTGSAARVQAAFGVELRRYSAGGAVYFANAAAASVPTEMAGMVAGVSGLSDKPAASSMAVQAMGVGGVALPVAGGGDALGTIEGAVDANAASMLTVSSAACSSEFGQGDYEAWSAALRQAEAQGITVLAASGCQAVSGKTGSFPASLAEVTAVTALNSEAADANLRMEQEGDGRGTQFVSEVGGFLGIAQRPGWQFADGLPADGFREEPDVTTDIAALAQTLAGVAQQAGTRLGNVAPTLYELAKTPGLYTQPDGAAAGADTGMWERTTGLGVVDLKVLAKAFPRGTVGTSSLLVASNYAPYHGKSLTLTATITSTGGSGIPTGTVTFTSTQQGTLGTGTLNAQGVATFTSTSLAGGTYTLTSVYSGDGTYTGSTSGTATVTVVGESSIITATVGAGAAVGGTATVNISVTSASGVGTPSGTVTVAPQGTVNTSTATSTLTGASGTGTAAVLLPVYQAGTFTLLVSCTDLDQSFTCYSPVSVQVTVAKGSSTTAITASPATPVVGQPYTLTATVGVGTANAAVVLARSKSVVHAAASSSQPTTGSVQFMDGTTVLGTEAVTSTTSSGVATYSGTATTGTHNFTAAYSGDQNYAASTSVATTTTTTGLPTSTSLTASSYAISVGQGITFYSTVFSPGVASTMTGTVTYSAAAQGVLGTGTVSGGLATLTLSSLAAGSYTLTATYSGDGTFAGSTSTTLVIVTVAQVPASLAGSITPVPLNYGSNAVLLASASFAPGVVGGPQGTLQAAVSGVVGDTFVQPLTASAAGPSSTATFTFGAPVPGRYSVVLSCTPSDTFPCAGPVTVPMTVLQGITSTTLNLSPAAPLAGAATTLTATIQNLGNNPNAYTFTGSVQFLVNNKLVGTAAVTGSTATLVVTLAAGSAEEIEAIYTGDTNWLSSTSNAITVSVASLVTATTLSSNVTQVIAGEQVVLTATVTGTATGVVALTSPTGTVDFYDTFNGVLAKLGSAALASYGANASIATFNATGLTTGTHVIYAVYTGDTVYSTSTSGTITLGLSNFSVSFVPATMTVTQGQSGSATLLVNFQGGFGGTVAFGCTPPANVEITCSFNPAVITAAGSTTLTVTTVAPSARSGGELAGLLGRFAGGAVMALVFFWIKPQRHRMKLGLLLMLLAIGASSMTGCTGTNGTGTNSGGTTAPPVTTPTEPGSSLGTQVLTITTAGSDGINTVRHDYQYQVTVQ